MNYTTKQTALLHHGYIQNPYPTRLEKDVNFMENLWEMFCNQNLEHKQQYIYTRTGGYEYKDPEEKDYKENFHISLNYDHKLPLDKLSEVDKDFFHYGKKLINDNVPVVADIVDIIDVHNDLKDMIMMSKDIWTLRLLHYPTRPYQKNQFLAVSHPDKAGITIHLTETMEGLEILWNETWKPIHKMAGHVIGYPGATTQYHTKCVIKGLCHRVRMLPEIAQRSRFSMVMFIDYGDIFYNKILGPTSEIFPNGENYLMEFEEFSKYFINDPNLL